MGIKNSAAGLLWGFDAFLLDLLDYNYKPTNRPTFADLAFTVALKC